MDGFSFIPMGFFQHQNYRLTFYAHCKFTHWPSKCFQGLREKTRPENRTVYVGNRCPSDVEVLVPEKYPPNRIVSSKVNYPQNTVGTFLCDCQKLSNDHKCTLLFSMGLSAHQQWPFVDGWFSFLMHKLHYNALCRAVWISAASNLFDKKCMVKRSFFFVLGK